VLSERTADEVQPLVHDLVFMKTFTQAVFAAPLEPDMHPAFRIGVRTLAQACTIGRVFEKSEHQLFDSEENKGAVLTEAIRKFLKNFAIAFYEEHGVQNADWETRKLTNQQKMLVEAFPVLWPGGIDYMFPVFFFTPPLDTEFNRVFVQRLCGCSRIRFMTFVHDHRIIDRIIRCAEASPVGVNAQNWECTGRALNPQVWQLAKFMATGVFKKSRVIGEVKAYPTPEEYREEYDRFSIFVVNYLLPYCAELANTKAQNLAL
jgi:hypothetical protein